MKNKHNSERIDELEFENYKLHKLINLLLNTYTMNNRNTINKRASQLLSPQFEHDSNELFMFTGKVLLSFLVAGALVALFKLI